MEIVGTALEKQLEQSLARQIFLSSRALKKLVLQKTRFEGFQLNMAHASILPAVDLKGSRLTEIALRAGMSKQAIYPYIQELESAGMLERTEDPEDRRANLILFTAKGKSLLEQIHRSLSEAEQAAMSAFGLEGYSVVREGLEHITQVLYRSHAGRRIPAPPAPSFPEPKPCSQPDLFANAFSHAAIGMALVGLDGKWLDVNDSLCRIVGYTKTELLGMSFQEITFAEDLSMDLTLMHHLLEGRIPSYNVEKRYIHKDGGLVWIHLTASIVRHSDGSPYHFIAQAQDITERKRKAENETLFFEISPDMLAVADASGKLIRVNGQWTETLGWSADELTSRPFIDFVHPEDRARTLQEARSACSGQPNRGFTNRYRCRDGGYLWLEWHTIVGSTGQLYCNVRDATDTRIQAY